MTMPLWEAIEIRRPETLKVMQLSDFTLNSIKREDKYNWSSSGELNKYKQFAPAFNSTEYEWFMELIRTFKRQCEAYNITYMTTAGSVLGAYRYHGFVPWDDDFDVQVNVSQKQNLIYALSGVPGYTLKTSQNYQWKFYSHTFGQRTPFVWNWPFVDIFFFEVNATHLLDVTHKTPEYIYPRSKILPLQCEIFENLILPVPFDMEAYLTQRYEMKNPCKSNHWDHKRERGPKLPLIRIPCTLLNNVYAVVHCFKIEDDSYEELRLGNKTLCRVRKPSAIELISHCS